MIHGLKLIASAVNELSGTIDLESTLIRAEALFRRFQRLVEAIDKKTNFPAPRFGLSTAAPSLLNAAANAAASAAKPTTTTAQSPPSQQNKQHQQKGKQPEQPSKSPDESKKTITPELRRLLSRDVEVLPRKEVAKKGDGFLAKSRGT